MRVIFGTVVIILLSAPVFGDVTYNQKLSILRGADVPLTAKSQTLKAGAIHLNTGKIAHGGFLSTIADTGMGTAAHQVADNNRCVTISLDIKFISAARLGQKLFGKVKIQKKTKTLVFINCEINNSENIVCSSSGVWKII